MAESTDYIYQCNLETIPKRRRRRGASRYTTVKTGRGRDKSKSGRGRGGWKARTCSYEGTQTERVSNEVTTCDSGLLLFDKSAHPNSLSHETPTMSLSKYGNVTFEGTSSYSCMIPCTQPKDRILQLSGLVQLELPQNWMCIPFSNGLNVVMISSGYIKALQRQVSVDLNGTVELYVHCKSIVKNNFLKEVLVLRG